MNELLEFDPEYKRVLSSYYDLLKTSILRKESKEFIGGLPITLLRKHVLNMFNKSERYRTVSKYTATSKVDGTRLLMFINDPDPVDTSRRKVNFIDRNLKIYTLSNKEKYSLSSIKGPKMILDGELVFFNGLQSRHYLPSSSTEFLSFMVFDILYGPTSIKIEDVIMNIYPTYGSANTMVGPIGGKQWDYAKRYNLLKNIIIPTSINNNNPPLSLEFADSQFFRLELKSLTYINELSDVDNVEKYVHNQFSKDRELFFKFLSDYSPQGKSLNEKYIKSRLSFDGLIFTPIDTEYITGNWNKFMNTQYKWKPPAEQTIDFYIKNTDKTFTKKGSIKKYNVVELYILSRGDLQKFNFKGSSEGLVPATMKIKDGSIAEFGYNPSMEMFVFNRVRIDKTVPNAWRTAETVKDGILKPFDINILSQFNQQDSQTMIRTLNEYLNKKQLNRFLLCTGNVNMFTNENIEKVVNLDNRVVETEIRIGKLKGKYFKTGVDNYKFENTIKLFDSMNWKNDVSTFLDANKGDIRTRYKFVEGIGLLKIESVIKNSLTKIDLDLSYMSSFDIRFSSAEERKVSDTINFPEATRITEKKRISYYDPNGIIRVDLTEVNLAEYSRLSNKINTMGDREFHVEFEILKPNNFDSVKKFIEYYISTIEITWD